MVKLTDTDSVAIMVKRCPINNEQKTHSGKNCVEFFSSSNEEFLVRTLLKISINDKKKKNYVTSFMFELMGRHKDENKRIFE